MTQQNGTPETSTPLSDLQRLQKRLDEVNKKREKPVNNADDGNLLGVAWKLSTEFLVSVLVGAALGYGLDALFGTGPWLLLVGLGFGFATGVRSVFRTAAKMDEMTLGVPIGDDIPDDLQDNEFDN